MIVNIDISDFELLPKNSIDDYILNLHKIINTSDNYDNYQWSLIEVIDNLNYGHFDIELDGNELSIFGVYIDDISEKAKNILLGCTTN